MGDLEMGRQEAFKAFIDKRMYNFNYLARAHGSEGEASPHWLNIMKLEAEDVNRGTGAIQWIPLTLAIGDAMELDNKDLVIHLTAIFEFFNAEKRYKSAPEKNVKHMRKVNYQCDLPPTEIKLPFSVSYSHTIITLCDVLGRVYEKIGKSSPELIEEKDFRTKVEKLDTLVKNYILVKLCNNMNNQCTSKTQQILYSIDSLYALNKVRH